MLIKNSILVKLSSIRCSDMELYFNATKDIKVSKFSCPCCNAPDQCEYISPYKRTMISAADNTPKVQYLSIYHNLRLANGSPELINEEALFALACYSRANPRIIGKFMSTALRFSADLRHNTIDTTLMEFAINDELLSKS